MSRTESRDAGVWVDAGALDGLVEGKPTLLRHGRKRLAVVRTAEAVHAIDDRCPHEGYPLTQGTVEGSELTCCYHNFKFDLRTGACGRGESVPTFETRTREGRVEVFVPAPDPVAERAAAEKSLHDGLFERRDGQIARDIVRLLQAGASPAEVAVIGASFDADRAPWGCTHALPAAADVVPMCARYPGPLAVRPLMQCFELSAESNVRRAPRPRAPAIDPGADVAAAEARYLAAIEAERIDEAEGLLRGALARGFGRAELEPWFFGPPCAHFIGFGHSLIYAGKVFDLIEAAGGLHAPGARAESLLVGAALEQAHATRDDVLPAWRWWRAAMDGARPHFDKWWAACAPAVAATVAPRSDAPTDEALVAALVGADRQAAFDAVTSRLAEGRLDAVVDGLAAASAERVRRFDPAIDHDESVQDGWLDTTHLFTFAQAIRVAVDRHRRPEVLALMLQSARMIQNAGVLDRAEHGAIPAKSGDLDAVKAAVAGRDADAAEALVRGWVADGRPLEPLRVYFEDLGLHDALTRPIVVVHLIKTAVAAFTELQRRPADARPVAAVARLAASPIRERFIGLRIHEAVRFIVDGKVPKLLT